MLVPKTAIHEDYLPQLRENQIGFAGQFSRVQAKAKTQSVYQSADHDLGLHALASYPPHVLTAPLGTDGIHELHREIERNV